MNKLIIAALFAVFAVGAQAQNRSIIFESPDWEQAVAKAKKENKLIFVDCYTTWCGPCKKMAAEVFTKDEVADYHNATFVNMKLDIENDEAGRMLREKHPITGVPTLLWIDPNTEELAHRTLGSVKWEDFLSKSKQAADPENNLAGLAKRYESGERTPEFMDKYLMTLRRTGNVMQEKSDEVAMAYLKDMPDEQFYSTDMWSVIKSNISDPLSPEFKRVMDNRARFYEILPGGEMDDYLSTTLNMYMYSLTMLSPYDMLAGKGLDKEAIRKYLDYLTGLDYMAAPQIIAKIYLALYENENNLKAYFETFRDAMKYNMLASDKKMYANNSFNTFSKIEDKALLQEVVDYLNAVKTEPYNAGVRDIIEERMPMLEKRLAGL